MENEEKVRGSRRENVNERRWNNGGDVGSGE